MANTSIYNAFQRMWHHITVALGGKSDVDHVHDDKYYTESEINEKFTEVTGSVVATYETKSDAQSKLDAAKLYADGVKNDLLNGAGPAYDTLKELGDLIDENVDAIEALELIASNKSQVQIITWEAED